MKKAMMVLLLLVMTFSASSAFASTAHTPEALIDDWNNRFIDPTYWLSKLSSEADNPTAVVPSEKHILQQDALRYAVEAIIQLGIETPESLSKHYDVKFGFCFIEDYDIFVWDIDLSREQRPVYTIRIDATTGQLFAIYVFDSSNIPGRRDERNHSIEALIDQWDKDYSDSPNYSPEVYAGEMEDFPLPGNDDVTQRTALHYAIEIVLSLSNHDIDTLRDYHPYVSFDVTPLARSWHITIFQETNDTGLCETFAFVINSTTGKLEQLTWRNIPV